MKKEISRAFAFLLAVVMMLSCTSVLAEEAVTESTVGTEISDSAENTKQESASEKEKQRIIGSIEFEEENKLVLYVSPDGNDSNSGTIDAPLASMVGARDKIRQAKESGDISKDGAVVYFRGGTYSIKKGIVFDASDAGKEGAEIVYRNYPGETVDFVGSEVLSWDDFKPVTDEAILNRIVDEEAREHIYSVNLKEQGFTNIQSPAWPGTYSYYSRLGTLLKEKYGVVAPTSSTSDLIINGKAMTVARYPNDGYMIITDVVQPGWDTALMNDDTEKTWLKADTPPTEIAVSDDRVKKWEGVKGAIMTGMFGFSWASQGTEIDKVNAKKNTIKAKYPMYYESKMYQQFYVFNLLEEIDMPGEYYIDVDSGIMYIHELNEEVEEMAYTILDDVMITFDNTEYITIKNINMKYTKNKCFEMTKNSKNCKLVGSEISYASNYGGSVYGSDNKVLDCIFHDNAEGIEVAGGNRATLTRGNNIVENTRSYRNDRLSSTYSPSVRQSGCGSIVKHCEIYDADHTLVSFSGNLNEFSYNNIYDGCQNADDMGAFYAGRNLTHRGNLIKYNYFHDIGGGSAEGLQGTHAIFLDDWWSAADMVGNVFENIPDGAAIMCAGSYNVMDNNLVINCLKSFHLGRSFNYGNKDDFAQYANHGMPVTSKIWMETFPGIENCIDEEGRPDMNNNIVATNNVLYNTIAPNISDQIKDTATIDKNVLYSKDPGFYDLEGRNYLLNEDAAVYKDIPDFKPIPFTRMGMYTENAMQRIKKAYVFCIDSAYTFKNGKLSKGDKIEAIAENNTMYVPLRSGAEAVGAIVSYDEETAKVTVNTASNTIEFTSGEENSSVLHNTKEYKLSAPIVKVDGTNYIAIADLVNIFDKQLVTNSRIAVISEEEELFLGNYDNGLLRYIEEQLTVY